MLKVDHLSIEFYDHGEAETVVKNVSFQMKEGEILGIVGESGSGKTQTALAVMGLLSKDTCVVKGTIEFEGINLLGCSKKELRKIQGKDITMIFQEPMTSLNPVMKIGPQVEEGLKLHRKISREKRREEAISAMRAAGLSEPAKVYEKYPHQLSGGMRQRVMIASALITKPKFMIADEPTTALDVTVQAQILRLLKEINEKYNTAILFISHDLSVIRKVCDRVLVMNRGNIVEAGTVEEVFLSPKEEYTKKLLNSIPTKEKRKKGMNHGEDR